MINRDIKSLLDNNNIPVYILYKGNEYQYSNYLYKYKNRITGVYWLLDGDEIVYIGYSTNLISRIKSHTNTKEWTKAKFVIINDKRLSYLIEFALLKKYTPKYNDIKYINRITVNNRFRLYKEHRNLWIKVYNDKINKIYRYRDFYSRLKEERVQSLIANRYLTFEEYSENFNNLVNCKYFFENLI